jgi:hypothetical protein
LVLALALALLAQRAPTRLVRAPRLRDLARASRTLQSSSILAQQQRLLSFLLFVLSLLLLLLLGEEALSPSGLFGESGRTTCFCFCESLSCFFVLLAFALALEMRS